MLGVRYDILENGYKCYVIYNDLVELLENWTALASFPHEL